MLVVKIVVLSINSNEQTFCMFSLVLRDQFFQLFYSVTPMEMVRHFCLLGYINQENVNFLHPYIPVQPRKTGNHPNMTEKLLTGMLSIKTCKTKAAY